jgi:multiple sugar transport system permease protein
MDPVMGLQAKQLAVPRAAGAVRRRGAGSFLRRYWFVYALILPAVLYRLLWTAWPLAQTIYLSFTDTNLVFRTSSFIGLENYAILLGDDQFRNSLVLTVLYTVGTVTGELVLGMLLALLLNQKLLGRRVARTVLLLPWAISAVLTGIVWKIIFWDVGGPANDLLLRLGLVDAGLPWLSQAHYAQLAVLISSIWKFTPFAALMLLAGLQTIPRELYEAAQVDGAGHWHTFRYITLPLVVPVVMVVLIFRIMEALRTFDQVYGLTQGGPGTATQVLSYLAFQNMFYFTKGGYGATIAVVMLLLTVATSGVLAIFLYRRPSQAH